MEKPLNDKVNKWIEYYKTSWKYLKRKGYIDAEDDGDCIFLNAYGSDSIGKLNNLLKEAVDKLKEETKKVINTIPTDGGFKLILFGKFMDKFDNIFGRFE